MIIYLAANYSRRLELCNYREQLREAGHYVPARWLNGSHQISSAGTPIGDTGEALVEGDDGSTSAEAIAMRNAFGLEDLQDIAEADLVICFTEPPRSGASRGGRHVELGYAIALRKRIWIVGYRENIFCWLKGMKFSETFSLAHLRSLELTWKLEDMGRKYGV